LLLLLLMAYDSGDDGANNENTSLKAVRPLKMENLRKSHRLLLKL